MIDFRYHLVSLISVFLALAVGIILGAGPLQGAIGETLTEQVDALRAERTDLRTELDATQTALDGDERFIEAVSTQLVPGSLEGDRIAVVELGDVSDDVRDGVRAQLDAAGAAVVSTSTLTEAWTDPDEESSRETVADGLRANLGDNAPEEEDAGATLGTALALALTGSEGGEGDAGGTQRSAQAVDLEAQLERFGFVEAGEEQTEAAQAVLLLVGPAGQPQQTADGSTEEAEPAPDTWTAVTRAVQQVSGAAVLAGPTEDPGDAVQAVRDDEAIAAEVSTVSGLSRLTGRITVPLAIAARLDGVVGQYGLEDDATAVLPPAAP
ncbi:copper transporter [Promicromonospora thailandica]|uniref:Copper transport outer membrane protein, MctB n=1 Tax=Promicromonospora thailandica TaxID=765201 RepID=A0A9X2JXD4_9MICO|nr:copper transporter [Promicromonospora thailandica]MCP2267136.1 Copper transport outer membrane protein, MctB [Promicromonospora thailandica]BFF17563.1 copper transporter [Promicromonospora thailandica]